MFPVIVLLLLLAAVLALASIMLTTVVLLKRTDCTFTRVSDLQSSAVVALLLAIAIMFVFSGGRFVLEHFVGPPALT